MTLQEAAETQSRHDHCGDRSALVGLRLKVDFMDQLEDFIKDELKKHIKLEDAIFGEHRRAKEEAHKSGRIASGFLTPFGVEPFKRGRERLGRAMAAFTARQSRKAQRPKSDK